MIGFSKFDAVIPKPISVQDIKASISEFMAGRLPLKPTDEHMMTG